MPRSRHRLGRGSARCGSRSSRRSCQRRAARAPRGRWRGAVIASPGYYRGVSGRRRGLFRARIHHAARPLHDGRDHAFWMHILASTPHDVAHHPSPATSVRPPVVFVVDDDLETLDLLADVAEDAGWVARACRALRPMDRALDDGARRSSSWTMTCRTAGAATVRTAPLGRCMTSRWCCARRRTEPARGDRRSVPVVTKPFTVAEIEACSRPRCGAIGYARRGRRGVGWARARPDPHERVSARDLRRCGCPRRRADASSATAHRTRRSDVRDELGLQRRLARRRVSARPRSHQDGRASAADARRALA